MNYPYNYLYEVHRFADAVETLGTFTRETFINEQPPPPKLSAPTDSEKAQHAVLDPISRESHARREQWTKDNPDIVCFMHALRVELLVQYVMRRIVPETEAEPFFLAALRFWYQYRKSTCPWYGLRSRQPQL